METIRATETEAKLPATLQRDRFLSRVPNGAALWFGLANKLGIDPQQSPALLGSGTKGSAYRVGDQALKLTTDTAEARAAAHVRKLPDPDGRVMRVSRVFVLLGLNNETGYAILTELLGPAEDAWADMADTWIGGHITPDSVENFFESNVKIPKSVTPELWAEYREWLTGVARYLERIGVLFSDLWADNLMRRSDGQHVLIDLGYSESQGAVENMADDTIASMLMEVARRVRRVIRARRVFARYDPGCEENS